MDISSFQSLSCVRLFEAPMDCSTPGFPVHHQFPECAHTHVLWIGDAIQPSHLLSSPSPIAFNVSQHQDLFQWIGFTYQLAKAGASASTSVLPMNIQDWFPLGLTGLISLQSKDSQESTPNTTLQKHQFFGAQLSLQSNSHIHTWLLENNVYMLTPLS